MAAANAPTGGAAAKLGYRPRHDDPLDRVAGLAPDPA